MENRFIGESGRLIADILETCDRKKLEGLLLAIDIEKAFDSLEHDFLIAVIEKYGFGGEFLNWIKISLNDQQSCVINGGHTQDILNWKGERDKEIQYQRIFLS